MGNDSTLILLAITDLTEAEAPRPCACRDLPDAITQELDGIVKAGRGRGPLFGIAPTNYRPIDPCALFPPGVSKEEKQFLLRLRAATGGTLDTVRVKRDNNLSLFH